MINCPRCESPVDQTTRTTCPICFSPLTTAPGNSPQPTPAPTLAMAAPPAPGATPPAYMGQPRTSLTGESYTPTPSDAPRAAPGGYTQAAAPQPPGQPARPAVPARVAPSPYPRREAEKERSEGSGAAAKIVVSLVLVLCLVGGGWWSWLHRTNPKGQMQHYLHATQWLDWGVVWDLSSPKPGSMARHEFVSSMNMVYDDNPLFKISARHKNEKIQFAISEPTFSGDSATVQVSVTDSPFKRDAPIPFRLHDFGGEWRVEPMEANPLQVIGAEPTKEEKEEQERKLREELQNLAAPSKSPPQ